MCASKNLGILLGIVVFLLFLVNNATGQIHTGSNEGFETNDFSRFPWESSGDARWQTTTRERHSGSFCAESGSIEDGESTVLQVTLNCVSGHITFYRKISSESDYDYLKFYIDGSEKGDWSGEEDWSEESFSVTTGTRTFKWIYSKDGSVSNGDDTAWIDDIVFPVKVNTEPAHIPFNRGVNLTSWFHFIPNAQQIQFTKFTKQDFINIKSLGCDVIRLPIDLRLMTNDEPDYTIDPLFYYYLDQVIDWAEDLGLHLILDNHTGGVGVPTDPDIDNFLVPVWTQMAQRYKDRSNLIYYEVLNEPHDISDAMWNGIQQKVVDAIRRVDQTHTIIVGPAGWNSYHNLKDMPVYADDNLIYTFHFYDPMIFTHQGAFWGNPPTLESLAGVPFPYDAARMPVCPAELEGTYWEERILNYHNEGTVEYVRELIDIAVDFQATRNVPIFCGEFGALMNNSYNEDRVRWHRVVRNYLEENGIAWTIWEYKGDLGLFEPGSQELFNYDLNIPLVEALGFAVPPQQGYTLMPDVTEFDLYTDYIAPKIVNSSWFTEGILDFFSEDNPVSGDFCIHWTGVNQYESISFRFTPIKDLSILVDGGFAIDFWVKCNTPSAKIDIRFVDTKTDDPDDHPWRMCYTIDRNIAVWNGQWNHLQIPLNTFSERGAWDDGYFNPIGAFDWTAIDRFEIVPEYGDLTGIHFYFDDIRVADPI